MIHRRYLNFSAEVTTLATRTGLICALFSIIYVLYAHTNLNLILAILGCFIASLIEITAFRAPIKEKLKYGVIISITAGITVTLGSILSIHPLLLSLGMLIFMWPVGLAASSNLLTASTVLFTANLFIIGSGIPATFHQALFYGVYFCMGGFILVLSTCLQNLCFKTIDDPEYYQKLRKLPIFSLTPSNLKFAIKLSAAVCAANAIAGYLKFPQQYCAPMTALLILKSDHDFSIERINHRLFGTLIGSILAGCLIVIIQNKLFLAILMLPVMFFIIVSMAKHYGAYVFFLTAMITILFNLSEDSGFKVTIERILFTLLGIASVVTVIYLSKLMSRTLDRNKNR